MSVSVGVGEGVGVGVDGSDLVASLLSARTASPTRSDGKRFQLQAFISYLANSVDGDGVISIFLPFPAEDAQLGCRHNDIVCLSVRVWNNELSDIVVSNSNSLWGCLQRASEHGLSEGAAGLLRSYFLVLLDLTILDGSGGGGGGVLSGWCVCLSLSRQITAPWKLSLERVHVSTASQCL